MAVEELIEPAYAPDRETDAQRLSECERAENDGRVPESAAPRVTDFLADSSERDRWNDLLFAAFDEYHSSNEVGQERVLSVLRMIQDLRATPLTGHALLALIKNYINTIWRDNDLWSTVTTLQALFARAIVKKWEAAGAPLPDTWSAERNAFQRSVMPDSDAWDGWEIAYEDPALFGDPSDPLNQETPFVREWFQWMTGGFTRPTLPSELTRFIASLREPGPRVPAPMWRNQRRAGTERRQRRQRSEHRRVSRRARSPGGSDDPDPEPNNLAAPRGRP